MRDLLLRRMLLAQLRSSLILSFKSLHERTFARRMPLGEVKAISVEKARALFPHPADQLLSGEQIGLVGQFQESVAKIEKHVLSVTRECRTGGRGRMVQVVRASVSTWTADLRWIQMGD